LSREEETHIFDLIGRLIQTISSPAIAIDDRHTPKLYARFLAGLLSKHRRDVATIGLLQTNPLPPSSAPPSHELGPAINVTFPLSGPAPEHDVPQDMPAGYQNGFVQQQTMVEKFSTPIYRPEATFAGGGGTISFGSDVDMFTVDGNIASDEEMLATMQALKNPAWWNTMMMPGYVFIRC
jgi:hypothetical protein